MKHWRVDDKSFTSWIVYFITYVFAMIMCRTAFVFLFVLYNDYLSNNCFHSIDVSAAGEDGVQPMHFAAKYFKPRLHAISSPILHHDRIGSPSSLLKLVQPLEEEYVGKENGAFQGKWRICIFHIKSRYSMQVCDFWNDSVPRIKYSNLPSWNYYRFLSFINLLCSFAVSYRSSLLQSVLRQI